jgi:hypothetical protein
MRGVVRRVDDIVQGAPHHVSEVGGIEGWRQEIEGAGFNGLHVKTRVHDPRYDDHIHGLCAFLGHSQDIGPRAIGQLRIREDQRRGVQPAEQAAWLALAIGRG